MSKLFFLMNLEEDLKQCNELKKSLDDHFSKYFSDFNFSFIVEQIVSKSKVLSFENFPNLEFFFEKYIIEKSYFIYIVQFICSFYEIEIGPKGLLIEKIRPKKFPKEFLLKLEDKKENKKKMNLRI